MSALWFENLRRGAGADRAAAALVQLAALLAPGDGIDPRVRDLISTGGMDWPPLLRLAGMHLTTPALAGALRRKGLFAALPDDIGAYLREIQSLNRARNDVLRKELAKIAAALNKIGVEPLLLKGANALLPGNYPGAEDRVIGDLDILVPAARHAEAEAVIEALGYQPHLEPFETAAILARAHHGAALLHPSLPVTIEAHRRMLSDEADSGLLQQHMSVRAAALGDGAVVLAPGAATRLLHNYLHAQFEHLGARRRRLDLRQLLEFAALAHHHAGERDAAELLSRLRPGRRAGLALYFALGERWLGLPYPAGLARAPGEDVRLWLVEVTATRPRAARLIKLAEFLRGFPRRLLRLIPRVIADPGYFQQRLKQFIRDNFRRTRL